MGATKLSATGGGSVHTIRHVRSPERPTATPDPESPIAKSRPSVQKRLKEARALEKKQAKEARKDARLAAQAERPEVEGDVDPDLVGLKPGPQAVPEWLTDDLAR